MEYLGKHFLSNESSTSICREVEKKIQAWPLTIDHHHDLTRPVVKHLIQLEKQNKIDPGTSIEIQNRLNQLARFGKWSSAQLQLLLDRILRNHGKKSPVDRMPFQSIRLILNDLVYAVELEIFLEKLAREHRIAQHFHHQFREFLYRIFQNELSLDQLTRHRKQLKHVYSIRYLNIEEVKRFLDLLPKGSNLSYPLTLTDQLLEQLKWNGKTVDNSMRDQLLKVDNNCIPTDFCVNDSFSLRDGIFYRTILLKKYPADLFEHRISLLGHSMKINRIDSSIISWRKSMIYFMMVYLSFNNRLKSKNNSISWKRCSSKRIYPL